MYDNPNEIDCNVELYWVGHGTGLVENKLERDSLPNISARTEGYKPMITLPV